MSSCNQRKVVAVLIMGVAFALSGCRQDPANDTKYYEREIEQVRRELLMLKRAEKPIKDGYPWRSKKPESSLPCRIKTVEKNIQVEIDYLHETIRGKKKTRLRLRD